MGTMTFAVRTAGQLFSPMPPKATTLTGGRHQRCNVQRQVDDCEDEEW